MKTNFWVLFFMLFLSLTSFAQTTVSQDTLISVTESVVATTQSATSAPQPLAGYSGYVGPRTDLIPLQCQ